MTTRAVMLAELAKDTSRSDSDINTLFTNAINAAIRKYQTKRFYFNETRTETFSTVADQIYYSSADDAEIPNFVDLDGLVIYDNGRACTLCRRDPVEFELNIDNSQAKGRPYSFTWYNDQIGLYPVPQQAYTVRMMGLTKKAPPATDAETGNVWMTEAYQLILRAAERYYYANMAMDPQMAQIASAGEKEAYVDLMSETARKTTDGTIRKTAW